VGWVSARKHMLACIFILICTIIYLNRNVFIKNKIFKNLIIGFSFVLSYFSNPIGLSFPVWLTVEHYIENRSLKIALIKNSFFLGISAFLAVFTVVSYRTFYKDTLPEMAKHSKVLSLGIDNLLLIPQMFGRVFLNFIFPFELSHIYSPYSYSNILGIALGVIFIYLSIKYLDRKFFLKWLSFSVVFTAMVLGVIGKIFVMDVYLLLPSIGFFILAYKLVLKTNKKVQIGLFLILLPLYLLKSTTHAKVWESDTLLWENAHKSQKSYIVLDTNYNIVMYRAEKREDFEQAYSILSEIKGITREHILNFYSNVAKNQNMTFDEKVYLISKFDDTSAVRDFYLAKIHFDHEKYQNAFDLLKRADKKMLERNEKGVLAIELKSKVCEKLGKEKSCFVIND
jgi:hypothetical protein